MKGARWRHRGRKPWAVDCVGIVVLAGMYAGRPFRDEKIYGVEPWEDQLRKRMREECGEPVTDEWRPGDIALIQWRGGDPSHLAIIADHPDGGLSIIHTTNQHGVVECSLSGPFLKVVVEVYRPWPVKFSQ